jgi:hypothetical protein
MLVVMFVRMLFLPKGQMVGTSRTSIFEALNKLGGGGCSLFGKAFSLKKFLEGLKN